MITRKRSLEVVRLHNKIGKISTTFGVNPLIISILLSAFSTLTTGLAPSLVPSSSKTATPAPTNTPISLDSFTPTMFGYDTHGNITCVKYNGNQSDLSGLKITADFIQNDKPVEKYVQVDKINNKMCFENIDSLYVPGEIVSVQIRIRAPSSEQILENALQIYELGKYTEARWFPPIFRQSDLDPDSLYDWNHTDPEYSKGIPFKAHDLFSSGSSEGLQIYMPGSVRYCIME